MILAEASKIFDAAQFAAGLEAASRGTVRLQVLTNGQLQSLATGWLITDSLVVVPTFAVSSDWTSKADTIHAVPSDGGEPIAVMPVRTTAAAPTGDQGPVDPSLPTLLRLATPLPQRALQLATATPRPDDQVFLLQYPNGLPTLMLSLGKLLGLDGAWIRYDADTQPGSGGAPVLSAEWRLLGMHARSSGTNDPDGRFNAGVSISAMLDRLRETEAWPEIAAQHGLADVTGARQEIATANAATRQRGAGAPGGRRRRPPDGGRVLDDRLGLGARGPPRHGGRPRHRPVPGALDAAGQRAGDAHRRVDAGPAPGRARRRRPSRTSARRSSTGSSPVRRSISSRSRRRSCRSGSRPSDGSRAWSPTCRRQAPSTARSAQRRSRSRLTDIAGPGFRGRKAELKQLDEWLDDPAGGLIAITGIGGVGKSALVAKLALDLAPGAVLLWLDFDRADLAPDNPASVLSILFEQVSLQVDGLELPAVDETSVQPALAALASLVAPALAGRQVLLVLDGFEVAQHAPRPRGDLGADPEQVLDQLPRASVVVCGRAPVGNITLAGRTGSKPAPRGPRARADAEGVAPRRGREAARRARRGARPDARRPADPAPGRRLARVGREGRRPAGASCPSGWSRASCTSGSSTASWTWSSSRWRATSSSCAT